MRRARTRGAQRASPCSYLLLCQALLGPTIPALLLVVGHPPLSLPGLRRPPLGCPACRSPRRVGSTVLLGGSVLRLGCASPPRASFAARSGLARGKQLHGPMPAEAPSALMPYLSVAPAPTTLLAHPGVPRSGSAFSFHARKGRILSFHREVVKT